MTKGPAEKGWIPVRKGRFHGCGSWQQQYQALRMTAEEAAAEIRDGDIVTFSSSANWPYAVDRALSARMRETGMKIEMDSLFLPLDTELMSGEFAAQICYNANFYTGERAFTRFGNIHFVPTHLSATGAWMCDCHPKVVVITCSPPDENGWMCRSLWGSLVARPVLEQTDVVIVEINDQLPVITTEGEAHLMLHVSEVDGIVENSHPLFENKSVPASEEDRIIAGYIADLVPDGACVQFGLGGLANAVGESLAYAGKKDLGIHSEVLGNCVVDLMEKGVINNSRKQLYPGRAVGAFYVGDRRLWDFVKDNPVFSTKEISWVNDARNICRNDRVVSVNNTMEVDLTGQVNAESVGPRHYSGTGGQLEWVLGSQWSKDGKSIIALRSSYVDKAGVRHSKICPQLPLGSAVTTPRTCVQYVVTEYGVANLRYKSVLERAKALIAIAHPDFREELMRQIPV